MSIDLVALKKRFEEHIASMSNEELMESARKAAELTAGCNDDWPDDLVEVVRCKDCWKRGDHYNCPMCISTFDVDYGGEPIGELYDYTEDNGFCHRGENKMNL